MKILLEKLNSHIKYQNKKLKEKDSRIDDLIDMVKISSAIENYIKIKNENSFLKEQLKKRALLEGVDLKYLNSTRPRGIINTTYDAATFIKRNK